MQHEKLSESRRKKSSRSSSSTPSFDYLNGQESFLENEQLTPYPERLRRMSNSNSSNRSKRRYTAWQFFKKVLKPLVPTECSQVVTFIIFLAILMVFNSLYLNLYYLPEIDQRINEKSKKYNLPNSNFFKKNLEHVAFPSITEQDDKVEETPKYSLVNKDLNSGDVDLLATIEHIEEEHRKKDILKKQKLQHEAQMALSLALNMQKEGKLDKAAKIYSHALNLDPHNTDALISYGEYLELHKNDIIKAEHFYTKVIAMEPKNDKASVNLKRASPLVNKLDRIMLDRLDNLLTKFYEIPATSSALKHAKREAYFMHIYHSNAIEGNTLNLHQTRHILQNRVAIGGKRLLSIKSVHDILEIHRRVLGFTDPIESGKFRGHQVYVGNFVPPAADQVETLIYEFIEWLNSNQLLTEAHPIQIAALAHYKFVYIHPFYDGNGRTARLLMNLILMKSGYPPVIVKKEDRLDYYAYLEMANQGDVKPFIRFIARCAKRTLEEYIALCNNHGISGIDINKIIASGVAGDEFGDEYLNRLNGGGEVSKLTVHMHDNLRKARIMQKKRFGNRSCKLNHFLEYVLLEKCLL